MVALLELLVLGVLVHVAFAAWLVANIGLCWAVSFVPVVGAWWPAYALALGAFNTFLWRVVDDGRTGGSADDEDALTSRPPLDP